MFNKGKFLQIERSESNNEIQAFHPKKHLNINLSIGGTKILAALINTKGEIIWQTNAHKWRVHAEQNGTFNIIEKRKWFISQIIQEILKAKAYLHQHFPESQIEGIGISWPGPIFKDCKLIGPNIDGFKSDQLSSNELISGGIDLS
jgi:predicted NBD/HSP70 family sugar kinase